ncbi:MAG TPA: transporter substrate-binding domain-containing protein [Atopostipes sp.]|nr:transporter substrate-binding domain-containing protein [Atopostipes sp.]
MKKINKKALLAIVTLFVGMVLVACGGSTEGTDAGGDDKLAEIQERGELVIGTSPDYPPLEFYILDENGDRQIAGSDITLAQAIADEIGVDLNIRATDFNGVIANVQSGSVDMGISGFTFTEERANVMQFSEGYLQESTLGYQGIMMQEEMAEQFDSLEDIEEAELVLGAQGGSIQYEMATNLTPASNVKQYGTLDVGLAALNEGDIDGMVVSTSSAEPMLTTFPNLMILPQDNFDLDPERLYSTNVIAFPQGEEYESLIELANEVIIENRENGNLEQWHEEAVELSRDAIEVDE